MTKKVFWENPYLVRLDTHIASVDGNSVTVEETNFYAYSGGQESDRGAISGHRVLEARKDGKDIIYTLEGDHGLQPGDPVSIRIDWERRYRLMRLHFAAELILELAYQNLEGIEKTGAHIAQDKARIDFRWRGSIATEFPMLLEKAQAIIAADLPIISAYSDEAAEARYWEVAGFARVPCGGTHLRSTGEVGDITLKRNNIGKGKERIEIFAADDTE
jgi:Ser-tRNA(Ala) deacylase AlaX